MKTSSISPTMMRNVGIAVLAVLALGAGVYAYTEHQKYLEVAKNPTAVPSQAQQEANAQLLADVGKLMVLPEGEAPTIATVVDPAKLKSQPFFADAKVGDKVLIYTFARKAILY